MLCKLAKKIGCVEGEGAINHSKVIWSKKFPPHVARALTIKPGGTPN